MNRTAKILWGLVGAAIVGYAVLYVTQGRNDNGQGQIIKLEKATDLAASHKSGLEKFKTHASPKSLPALTFSGPDGQPLTLESFKGKVVLLNVWATWCAPCRVEMPSLDRLQRDLGSDSFEVVALSVDRTGLDGSKKFFEQTNVRHLKVYADATAKLTKPLDVVGMPTTLLIDSQGRELGRLAGPAEWDSAEAKKLIQSALNSETSSQ